MIHQYKFGGQNIVLDVCSGGVHVVDDLAYDLISMFESHTKEETVNKLTEKYSEEVTRDEVMECWEQVDQLKKAGMLFSEDSFEPLQDELKRRSEGIVKALCLHVAHSCNLNCEYCFASQGKYSGERALMSFETGKRALDFLIEHSGSRRNLEVDFFGGEPLMNWQVLKDLVKYARSVEKQHNKNFRFTLTTNGMLIDDEVIEFSNREMSNVVLSLDGRREIHDRYRVDYEGRGSWDRIVPKFQEFVKRRGDKNYYIRGTFTHANPDFLKDIETMLDLGFTELSMEPVVAAENDP
ncbi:MAG: thioether cross-link-forming SCIFF peptide maturase, partial [Firmicutes bacterium]|nr:thioether cross-link-forming SCIFF peptide maturase [Bacillota bacterium]